MAITISQYIDAVANPNGRFRTLDGIYPVPDSTGEPQMKVNDYCADFTMILGGEKYTLKCLLSASEKHRERLRGIATFTRLIATPYLAPCSYLEEELMVFDSNGNPRRVDVILQKNPEGETLGSFLAKTTGDNDTGGVAGLMDAVTTMAHWMRDNDFGAGRISLHSITVTPSGKPVLVDHTNAMRKHSTDELRAWGSLAAALYCCAAEPALYESFVAEHIAGISRLLAFAATLSELLADEPGSPLSELAAFIAEEPEDASYTDRLLNMMDDLAGTEIARIEALRKMAGFIYAPDKSTKETDKKENSAEYLFIGDMSCNKMKAYDGKFWHYIDKNGDIAVAGRFLEASDFQEGRAVVETETGYGLIDEGGNFVIDPMFDDINWDNYNNIVIATKAGKSGLYFRSGEQVSDLVYDQILECSDGLLPARKGRLFGYVSKDGTESIDFIYDDAFSFRNGIARVKRKGRESLIDTQGNEIDTII